MAKPWFLLLALTGCSEPADPAVRTVHREALLRTRRAQPAPPERPAPTEGPWLQELRDENGTRLAMFSPPLGVQERRPLAVGLHGAYDHPSSACGEWRGTLGAYPFVLCPFGHRAETLERSIAALRARYPDHLDLEAPLLGGFSLGSILIPSLAAGSQTRFAVAVMAEGYPRQGLSAWKPGLESHGLRRLVLVNTQPGNRDRGAETMRLFGAGSIAVRNVYLGSAGHAFGPFLAKSIRSGLLAWLDDLPGWRGYVPPPLDAP